jgi:hypothetical protein
MLTLIATCASTLVLLLASCSNISLSTCRFPGLLSSPHLCLLAMLRDPMAGEDDGSSISSLQAGVLGSAEVEGSKRKGKREKTKVKKKNKENKEVSKGVEGAASASSAQPPKPAEEESAKPTEVPASFLATEESTSAAEASRRKEKSLQALKSDLAKTKKDKNTLWTADQGKLLILMMKLILQGAQANRDYASILFDVYLAPADSPLIQACRVQGRRYAAAVAQPGHGLGSPWLYVFGALLDSLATLPGAESADSSNSQNYEKLSLTLRGEQIKLCKVAQVYRTSQVKLVLSFGVGPDAQALRNRILSRLSALEGFEHKPGRSPPTHMERVLSAWVEEMVQ